MDFTVVIEVRQRFGRRDSNEPGLEEEAPFVGAAKTFSFQCPDVDSSKPALLLFESQGVSRNQPFELNGQRIPGGLTPNIIPTIAGGSVFPFPTAVWNGNIRIVPAGLLRETNELSISAGSGDNLDSFIIDNMVALFKTRPPFLPR